MTDLDVLRYGAIARVSADFAERGGRCSVAMSSLVACAHTGH